MDDGAVDMGRPTPTASISFLLQGHAPASLTIFSRLVRATDMDVLPYLIQLIIRVSVVVPAVVVADLELVAVALSDRCCVEHFLLPLPSLLIEIWCNMRGGGGGGVAYNFQV